MAHLVLQRAYENASLAWTAEIASDLMQKLMGRRLVVPSPDHSASSYGTWAHLVDVIPSSLPCSNRKTIPATRKKWPVTYMSS